MTQTVAPATTARQPPFRRLGLIANVSMAYPLLFLALLYAQWLSSWVILGHVPRPSIDDPKDVAGASWMHWVTAIALAGLLPMLFGALVLNAIHGAAASCRWLLRIGRLIAVLTVFVGVIAWIRWDPGRVVYWWLD
jgi:hypothetical protein